MTEFERRLRPRAFRLNGDEVVTPKPRKGAGGDKPGSSAEIIEPDIDVFALEAAQASSAVADESAVEAAQVSGLLRRTMLSWGGMFVSALGGLVSLAATMWVYNLVADLFTHSAILGAIGMTLAGALAVAAIALLTRELRTMARQQRIAKLHIALAQARVADDGKSARASINQLCGLYTARPETGRARASVLEASKQIIDGRDLIDLAERTLMAPLDDQARREVAAAAKRVSMVTTFSPRAILDVIFVAVQAIALMRKIAEIYGGRPGLLGFFKLARSVGAHLAITGGLAVGDSVLQQIVGHGIAARLSAKLGEGVLNGLLTARVGISAMAVCRPMPYAAEKQPGVTDVAPFLFGDKSKS
jgi:putative membrane protein